MEDCEKYLKLTSENTTAIKNSTALIASILSAFFKILTGRSYGLPTVNYDVKEGDFYYKYNEHGELILVRNPNIRGS